MNEKKNIDRLFQEKFRDFEVTPPEMVWGNIEAELLKKKQKRRVIPLWYRLGGVAALLVIGLAIGFPLVMNNNSANTINSVVVNDTEEGGSSGGDGRIYPTNDPIQPNEVVTDALNPAINTNSGADGVPEGLNPDTGARTSSGNKQNKRSANTMADDAVASESAANSVQNPKLNKAGTNKTILINNNNQSRGVIANNGSKKKANKQSVSGTLEENSAVAQQNGKGSNQRNSTGALPAGSNGRNQEAIAEKDNSKANSPIDNNSRIVDPGQQLIDSKNTNNAVADAAAVNDSTVTPQENELEKILKEKMLGKKNEEEKAIADNNNSKWNLKPQMAPVFYNSMSNGSPIDPQLANNSKSYDNDLSYGLGINYAVNDRISIRSGINTVNLSYATNGIQFYAALNEQTPNVAARGTRANIVVQDQGAGNGPASNGFASEGITGQTFNGSMVQKMGYIEVPLEMSYKLLNKRFGIDVIGGVSTLFLNDNNVSVVSNQGLRSDMGEAQNLNNVHFSTNIGVGFRYRFWKAFEANFEPMFKYQVNTFSGDSGNFKPYFIGLYSGISFSF